MEIIETGIALVVCIGGNSHVREARVWEVAEGNSVGTGDKERGERESQERDGGEVALAGKVAKTGEAMEVAEAREAAESV